MYLVGIDTPYPDVWIIIPAFNEAQVIGDVIADLRQVFSHVVCVDDGSRDDTADVALRAGAHVVPHPVNLGQGAAIQTGVEYARRQPGAAVFVTFDADGQHRVKDVLAMIDRLSKGDVDVVVGTRFAGTTVSHTPPLKKLILRTAAALSPSSHRLGLTDAHNGLRVFNKTRRRQPQPDDERDEPRQRVRQAHRREQLAGGRGAGRDPLHRLLDVEGPAAAQRGEHRLRRVPARKDAPMNWIQVLLIASVVALLVYLLRSRTNTKAKAWVKVGYVAFVIVAVYAILRPDDTTVVANWLGVRPRRPTC